MRKSILVALLMVAVMAVPSFAATQNIKMSGSVDSTYIHRSDFDFGATNAENPSNDQNVFITQTILRVDADLTDQVGATVALINERVWQNDPGAAGSDVDIFLAYVTLREMLYSPLTVIAGRQQWGYGNNFIFHSTGTNNSAGTESGINNIAEDLTKQSGLDAIRAILDYNPLKVEVFYAVHTPNSTGDFDSAVDSNGIWLYGLNTTYELGDDMNSVVEGYFFGRKDRNTDTAGVEVSQQQHLKIIGGRVSTNPFDGLNLQAEIAHQGGRVLETGANDKMVDKDAWGYQAIANYQIPEFEEYNPVLSYVYTKVYGDDSDTADDENNSWDPFFESQASGTIYNTLFNLSNAVIHTVSLSANPMEDVKTTLSFTKLWMQQNLNDGTTSITLIQPATGGTAAVAATQDDRALGVEVDLVNTYAYTEDVTFGLNLGVFKPGEAFVKDPGGVRNSYQALANVNVNF